MSEALVIIHTRKGKETLSELQWYGFDKSTLHREDGPALEFTSGTKYWYLNGNRHRVDGPAVEHSSGSKYWYLNGNRHRVDGPAVEHFDGIIFWYLDNQNYTGTEFYEEIKKIKEMTTFERLLDPRDWVKNFKE